MRELSVRIIGNGKAGQAFAQAFEKVGTSVDGPLDKMTVGSTNVDLAFGVNFLILAVPDGKIASLSDQIPNNNSTTILHLSGSLGLDVLSKHTNIATLHPLAPLPNKEIGAMRLLSGILMAYSGNDSVLSIVEAFNATPYRIKDSDRTLYHACATVATNHVVALMNQVENLAMSLSIDPAYFMRLSQIALQDVIELGSLDSLTGPAKRNDSQTIESHKQALIDRMPEELELYEALLKRAVLMSSELNRGGL